LTARGAAGRRGRLDGAMLLLVAFLPFVWK